MEDKTLVVTKHNDLIEASYMLNLEEQRLLLLCIAKIDSQKTMPDQITISASEFGENFGLCTKNAYRQLKAATNDLYERDIKIRKDKKQIRMRWVYCVNYHDGEGKVTLKFSPTIVPYLCQLQGIFKSYQLKNICSIKSTHSIRLYELVNQWRDTGKRFVRVDDFKDMLQLGDKYERYVDLRKWVIEPAIRELNSKSDLIISFQPEKEGRKVVRLNFSFIEKSGSIAGQVSL